MIRYERFTKRFGRVTAVDALDLDVIAGETLALIGPNGSGKTTTLKAALGLVRATTGRVTVDGLDVETAGREARSRVGYLPQRLTFPDGLTAREVLRFYARVRGAEPELRLLERVDLLDAADRVVDGFSGGMRQRLGIAIALLGSPQVLVLDEPTASLDPSGALTVRDIVTRIANEGTTVLLSSHDLAEVAALADRVAVFMGGSMRALGTPDELTRATGVRELRIHQGDIGPSVAALEDVYRRVTTPHPKLVAKVS
jgi:Cu-processing system ATP-binding protein